jgi:hypothetical protein
MTEQNMSTDKKTARLAGLLYLFLAITGAYSLMYVPSQIMVRGDAAASAGNILSHEFLFRTGIISDLISNTIFVFLVLLLYRLFRQVNRHQARLMVALVLVQIPTVFIMEGFNIASLMILKGGILKTYEISQQQDLAMLFIKINYYGTMTLEMFWGVWLIPFGQLVYKSGFIPRILGVFLIINGIAYIIVSFTFVLLPGYMDLVSKLTMPLLFLGEIPIMLWLLIKGVNEKK